MSLPRFAGIVLFVANCSLAPAQQFIGFDYNKTLVLKQHGVSHLILVNGHADPIFYRSKAYLTVWKLDSLDQLNAFLQKQSDSLIIKPKGIDESQSTQIVVDTGSDLNALGGNFEAFGCSFRWMPGGHDSGTFHLNLLKQPIKVAVLNQRVRFPLIGDDNFVDLPEYSKRYAKERADRLKDEREKWYKELGIDDDEVLELVPKS